jgi:hypothetical protein
MALIFITVILASAIVFAGVRGMFKLPLKSLLTIALPVLLVYASFLIWQPGLLILSNLAVLAASIVAGCLLGTQLKIRASIFSFAIAASIADMVSFSGGLTHKIISHFHEGKSLLLQYLAISIPLKGKTVPIIGIGDLLIMAALFYALLKLKYPGWQSFAVPLGGLLAALVVGLLTKGVFGIPFICGAVVLFLVFYKKKSGTADKKT